MNDLISRSALLEQVKAIHKAVDTCEVNLSYDTGFHSATSQIQGLIAYMPAVDAVEVVRCKDCKQNEIMKYGCLYSWCKYLGKSVMDDNFCSYGERRNGNATD